MTLRVHADVANGACDAAVDRVDTGSGTAVLQLWSGGPPENLGDAPDGTLLASFNLQNPAFGNAGAGPLLPGVAELAGLPLLTSGLANGSVGFARVLDRDGDPVWDDSDVGTADAAIVVSSTTVEETVPVEVTGYLFRTAPPTISE